MQSINTIAKRKLITIALALLGPIAFSQSQYSANTLRLDSGTVSPPAKIEQLSWLTGTWKGEGFGGFLEESWLPPAGGSMVSVFRMIKNNKPVIFEINQIVEENNSLTLKVKHFNGNLKAWEEKEKYVSFPLVKIGSKNAWFDGLTFILDAQNNLIIYLVTEYKDGRTEEDKLSFKRTN